MINELFAVSTSSPPNCEDSPRNFVPINQFPEERRAPRVALFHYRIALAKTRARCSYFGTPQTACQTRGNFLWRRISSRSPVNLYASCAMMHMSKATTRTHTRENVRFPRNSPHKVGKITNFSIPYFFFFSIALTPLIDQKLERR